MGGTSENMWLSRTFRATRARPQQQGSASSLRKESGCHGSAFGGVRANDRVADCRPKSKARRPRCRIAARESTTSQRARPGKLRILSRLFLLAAAAMIASGLGGVLVLPVFVDCIADAA